MSTLSELLQTASKRPLNAEERNNLQKLLNSVAKSDTVDIITEALFRLENPNEKDEQFIANLTESIFSLQSNSQAIQIQKPVHRIHFIRTAWFRYAAAILIVLGISVFFFLNRRSDSVQTPGAVTEIIQPGTDKATLTLSDGRQVILSDSANQLIADGKISINKEKGVLSYNPVLTSDKSTAGYNIMSTPRGGQYQLVLPDGSRVVEFCFIFKISYCFQWQNS